MGARPSTLNPNVATRSAGGRWALVPILGPPAAAIAFCLLQAPAALAGQPWRATLSWIPSLDLQLAWQLDGLSLIFALLAGGIGLLVAIYSLAYMAGERGLGRYYGALLLFMGAMLGVVTAGNLLTLFVFWELTGITSYLLIGFRHEERASQENAQQALLITAAGGLALMAGIVLLREVYGTFDLATILSQPELLRGHRYYGWVLGLLLLGAFTKSAQVPFHIWLPNAMVAPTPVSAYLHSATMVKAGIYLLLRLAPVLGGTAAWQHTLLAVGALTMLLGAWRALHQRDMKAILAYTTISSLGMMVALVGAGSGEAIQAALALLIAHALYKAALFLVVGAIDHATGTRDVTLLGGLRQSMPALGAVALLAGLAMAGLPPTFSFLAKELSYAAAVGWAAAPLATCIPAALLLAANASNVALAVVLGYRVFCGPPGPWEHKPAGPSWLLVLPPALLVAAAWVAGPFPGPLEGAFGRAVELVQPAGPAPALQLWHGWGWPLALSAATLAVGAALYRAWPWLLDNAGRRRLPLSAARAYDWLVGSGLPRAASAVTRALQNGSLRAYLMVILVTAVLFVGSSLVQHGLPGNSPAVGGAIRWPELAMGMLLIVATLGVILAPTRVSAIILLGVVGTVVTIFFVRFGAPDLALTQLLVESLTVILLLLVFYHLPPGFPDRPRRLRKVTEVGISIGVGALMAVLVVVANGIQLAPPVAGYYQAHSLPLAHGHNIVNVILVDFRGFDTLGEITVLATAAFGFYALLGRRGPSS